MFLGGLQHTQLNSYTKHTIDALAPTVSSGVESPFLTLGHLQHKLAQTAQSHTIRHTERTTPRNEASSSQQGGRVCVDPT